MMALIVHIYDREVKHIIQDFRIIIMMRVAGLTVYGWVMIIMRLLAKKAFYNGINEFIML